MGVLARTKLSTRMQLLVGLTLVGLLVLCVTALFQLKETMLDDRKEKVHNIVEVGLGIIAHHHKLAADGKLSEAEAKQAARDALRGLRFASSDYYFGIDTSGVYYLHGGNPAFEGQLKIDLKDTIVNGVAPAVIFLAVFRIAEDARVHRVRHVIAGETFGVDERIRHRCVGLHDAELVHVHREPVQVHPAALIDVVRRQHQRRRHYGLAWRREAHIGLVAVRQERTPPYATK
mgnify:CR=1 FL=1